MATAGTISPGRRRVAAEISTQPLSRILALQAMNNISLNMGITPKDDETRHQIRSNDDVGESSSSSYRVIFPNRNNYGPLIPPARGHNASLPLFTTAKNDDKSSTSHSKENRRRLSDPPPTRSNLSALMDAQLESQQQQQASTSHPPLHLSSLQQRGPSVLSQDDSRDSLIASEPSSPPTIQNVVSTAPSTTHLAAYSAGKDRKTLPSELPPPPSSLIPPSSNDYTVPMSENFVRINSRKCLSNKELSGLVPTSSGGSPYAFMLYKKDVLESQMTARLKQTRKQNDDDPPAAIPPSSTLQVTTKVPTTLPPGDDCVSIGQNGGGSNAGVNAAAVKARMTANEARNRRRAEHNRAVRNDLCEIVTDLFVAESKLLNPTKYGVDGHAKENRVVRPQREKVYQSIDKFLTALPPRYALSAETPSEVLLHMRLMQAVRLDPSRPTVHIANVENEKHWANISETAVSSAAERSTGGGRNLMLVTIACADAVGLLEYISKLLASGNSRVLDADVMLSSDNIVLDRFVVEMDGRLRLDKLASYVGKFLEKSRRKRLRQPNEDHEGLSCSAGSTQSPLGPGGISECSTSSKAECSDSLYYQPLNTDSLRPTSKDMEDEIKTALPLSALLAGQSASSSSSDDNNKIRMLDVDKRFQPLCRNLSLPPNFRSSEATVPIKSSPRSPDLGSEKASGAAVDDSPILSIPSVTTNKSESGGGDAPQPNIATEKELTQEKAEKTSVRKRRPLVNRPGSSDLDNLLSEDTDDDDDEYNLENKNQDNSISIEYVTLNGTGSEVHSRHVPLIPFDELMLIETLGMGRVSTIYRAAWSRPVLDPNVSHPSPSATAMLALKVAMVNQTTMDTSHVDELRREADIAARLDHPNICSLLGVAADAECFCLAYEFCEHGSLLSLLSDSQRYYEYLPIALDIANAMAYLHSRNVIHRDLKPSNILLTGDNRAKIADFGMSVTHTGQELTAETGTYRYMAPEVIRHESYSSNADVYSFGICLWQLITRDVPFASMTPIQAAFAVAEGRRPTIPDSTPAQLRDIISACWDQDSRKRPSFTYIAMALADYAKKAFSPANIGMQTLNIANEMLATVEGNSTVNVDFSAPVLMGTYLMSPEMEGSSSTIGLEI